MGNLDSKWSEDDGGLPVPPLDDLLHLPPYCPTTLDLIQFFDGIDDDEVVEDKQITSYGARKKEEKAQHNCKGKEMKILIHVLKPENPRSEPKSDSTHADAGKKDEPDHREKRGPSSTLIKKSLIPAEGPKIESTKRKLQESYEKNAKKKRRIQVIEYQPIPKQAASYKPQRPTISNNYHCSTRLLKPKKLGNPCILKRTGQ